MMQNFFRIFSMMQKTGLPLQREINHLLFVTDKSNYAQPTSDSTVGNEFTQCFMLISHNQVILSVV